MKTIFATTFLITCFVLPLLAEEAKQPLIVKVPATWKVQLIRGKGMQFYIVRRENDDTTLLVFSSWTVKGNVNQIPEKIKELAEDFVATDKNQKDFKLKTDKYKIEEIYGETFSGRYVQFEMEGGISEIRFMVGDEEAIWSGQFTGNKERWSEALGILKTLKKNG